LKTVTTNVKTLLSTVIKVTKHLTICHEYNYLRLNEGTREQQLTDRKVMHSDWLTARNRISQFCTVMTGANSISEV